MRILRSEAADPGHRSPLDRTEVRKLFDLNVLIRANVEDLSEALSAVPDAEVRLVTAREELWRKIGIMTYAQ